MLAMEGRRWRWWWWRSRRNCSDFKCLMVLQCLSEPLPEMAAMGKSSESYVPMPVMVYAVIFEPSIVDNPDVPSCQPYVHGRCDPPALIPLHMHRIEMEVDCDLDTAFVTVSGTWRVHCVVSSKSCDCRIMIPMGDHGSVLGVEVDDGRRSYHIQMIPMEDEKDSEKSSQSQRWVPTETADIHCKSSPG